MQKVNVVWNNNKRGDFFIFLKNKKKKAKDIFWSKEQTRSLTNEKVLYFDVTLIESIFCSCVVSTKSSHWIFLVLWLPRDSVPLMFLRVSPVRFASKIPMQFKCLSFIQIRAKVQFYHWKSSFCDTSFFICLEKWEILNFLFPAEHGWINSPVFPLKRGWLIPSRDSLSVSKENWEVLFTEFKEFWNWSRERFFLNVAFISAALLSNRFEENMISRMSIFSKKILIIPYVHNAFWTLEMQEVFCSEFSLNCSSPFQSSVFKICDCHASSSFAAILTKCEFITLVFFAHQGVQHISTALTSLRVGNSSEYESVITFRF